MHILQVELLNLVHKFAWNAKKFTTSQKLDNLEPWEQLFKWDESQLYCRSNLFNQAQFLNSVDSVSCTI